MYNKMRQILCPTFAIDITVSGVSEGHAPLLGPFLVQKRHRVQFF